MKAVIKKINYTPRKLRLVTKLVNGMNVEYALQYLKNVDMKGALIVYKGIKSAVSNAQNKGYNPYSMKVNLRVDNSIILKRIIPVSRGRAFRRLKRYSTLIVNLHNG